VKDDFIDLKEDKGKKVCGKSTSFSVCLILEQSRGDVTEGNFEQNSGERVGRWRNSILEELMWSDRELIVLGIIYYIY